MMRFPAYLVSKLGFSTIESITGAAEDFSEFSRGSECSCVVRSIRSLNCLNSNETGNGTVKSLNHPLSTEA